MKQTILVRNHRRERALRRLTRFLVRRKLSRHVSERDQVKVTLDDSNGPKGGQDKVCKILVQLPRSKTLVVKAKASTSTGALHRALRKARSALKRARDNRFDNNEYVFAGVPVH